MHSSLFARLPLIMKYLSLAAPTHVTLPSGRADGFRTTGGAASRGNGRFAGGMQFALSWVMMSPGTYPADRQCRSELWTDNLSLAEVEDAREESL